MKNKNTIAMTGFILCFGAIIFGIATNGGLRTIMNFIHIPSLIVTLGGSVFAVMIMADSLEDYLDGFKSLATAFHRPPVQPDEIADTIFTLSDISRKEGLLSLEENAGQLTEEFLSKGIRLIVDGSEPDLVKDILENELYHKEGRDKKRVRFWQDLGACAPAWGMVGTLLGLINMMRSMGTDPDAIGEGMSLALITTLYGSIIANWVCIPIARKLEKNSEQETLVMEVVIEGVLSIQAGENTRIIKEKIRSILNGKEEDAPERTE